MRVKYYNQQEVDWLNETFGRALTLGKSNKAQMNQKQKDMFLEWRKNKNSNPIIAPEKTYKDEKMQAEFEAFQELQKQKGTYEHYKFTQLELGCSKRETVAIIQMGDQHIDEVVTSESVMGLNEYNLNVAVQRQEKLFQTSCKLIAHHQQHYNINEVILIFGGDSIGNWIHPELEQTNSVSPNEAIHKFKGMVVEGLKYIYANLNVERIRIICVSGNHPRETKKIQFSNFSETNKEYWMYLDLQQITQSLGMDKIKWYIPKSEMAVFNIFGKNYLAAHGHQFKYAGGIGGIFPSMYRWFGNVNRNLNIETAFIFHWHQSIFTKKVIVNGTPKGFDAFALGKGFEFEKPSQNMILLDSKYGITNFQQIFL